MIDLSTSYLGLKLRYSAGGFGLAAVAAIWTASAGWKMPAHPPWCSTRCSKSSCGRKQWNSITTCQRAPRASPSRITYFPQASEFHTGPRDISKHIRKAKAAVDIPIIASLNGVDARRLDEIRRRDRAGRRGRPRVQHLLHPDRSER